MLKKNLLTINKYNIFLFSILACVVFFYFERFLGIDKFYHPDSLYYLTKHETFTHYADKPETIITTGYHYLSRILNYDYLLLIILNFITFGLTNLIAFNLVLKNNLFILSKSQIFILTTILFFDPYRLHLAGHVLKETLLIFLILSFLYFKNFFIKLIPLFISLYLKKNIIFYYLIFYLDKFIKKIFRIKDKFTIIISSIFLILVTFIFLFESLLLNQDKFSILNFFTNSNQSLMKTLEIWHYRDMTGREFDNIPNFQNISFPLALIYKIATWPVLIFSGFFLFFTNSFLFKILGFMMIYLNVSIYYLTKKSYMTIGLVALLILLSLYSTTFTSYFRYSYVAIYCAIVFFFSNLSLWQKR